MPLFILIGGCLLTIYTNPYYFIQLNEGDGRLADERDVKKWDCGTVCRLFWDCGTKDGF